MTNTNEPTETPTEAELAQVAGGWGHMAGQGTNRYGLHFFTPSSRRHHRRAFNTSPCTPNRAFQHQWEPL